MQFNLNYIFMTIHLFFPKNVTMDVTEFGLKWIKCYSERQVFSFVGSGI